ncbi:MAG: thiamine-phosphate kinase, partial [Mycetocola reblochoni]
LLGAFGGDIALVLRGGEDHALLACFPPGPLPEPFLPIGSVVDGRGVRVDGRAVGADSGWDPYRAWDGGRG